MTSIFSSSHPPGARSSSGLLKAILESTTDYAVVSLDLHGTITSWNEGATRLFGWSDEAACGQAVDLIFIAEDRIDGVAKAEMSEVLSHGRIRGERWHQRADGTRLWAGGEMLPLRDEAGMPFGFLKILTDRTSQKRKTDERRNALEALPDVDAYLKVAIDAGQMAIWDLDVATETLAGSPELYGLFGFDPDESPNLDDVRARYFPGERERLQQLAGDILGRGDRYAETEFRCVWPDGSVHWLLLRAEVFKNHDGTPRRYVGVLFDISHRKAREAEFEKSEALKAAMLEASLDSIITVDEESRIVEWNGAAERMFGLPRAATLGQDLAELIIPERWRDAHRNGMSHFLATGEGPVLRQRIEVEAMRADGTAFPVELAISPVTIGDRKFFTAFLRDITGRKEAEAQRGLLTRELAHRVKNTLAMVQAIVGQTLRNSRDLGAARQAIDTRLVALAEAHDRLLSSQWSEAPIAEVVEGALRPYRTVEGRFRIQGPPLDLDSKQALALSLALHELATNATKYGALSTETGHVTISWRADPAAARLRFEWKESGGPPVAAPARTGFGSRMIQRSLAGYFRGSASIDYAADGLHFVLEAPLTDGAEAR